MERDKMDLIYANEDKKDLGVLEDYSFDMEYGKDSNDFSCKVQSENHVCKEDFLLYVEYTEYGGIVDRIESDTKTGVVTYKGRTWHGVLNSFVIEPPKGKTYRTFHGDANKVIQDIVNLIGMSDLFVVESELSGVRIDGTIRYQKAYDAICQLLSDAGGKLICYWYNGKVYLCALDAVNYAVNEEFDNTQVPFKVGYSYNNVNHLVCLGQGEGAQRAVIHLFTDDGGNVQDYYNVPTPEGYAVPMQDSDYILDKRNQVMFGREEITEIFDEPNAEIVTNYLDLETVPKNWDSTYTNYYYSTCENGNEVFKQLEKTYADVYVLQSQSETPGDWGTTQGYKKYYYQYWDETAKEYKYKNVTKLSEEQSQISYELLTSSKAPDDWKKKYSSYYTRSGASPEYYKYSAVSSLTETKYTRLEYSAEARPEDWEENYASYYTRSTNGVEWSYSSVKGEDVESWKLQKKRPNDWGTNYKNYYVKPKARIIYNTKDGTAKYIGQYVTVADAIEDKIINPIKLNTDDEALNNQWSKNTFYTKYTKKVAPDYMATYGDVGGYFMAVKKTLAPTYKKNKYYKRIINNTPAWEPNKYYILEKDVEQIPVCTEWWHPYYYAVEDRYKNLVKDALERLDELRDTSTLDVKLELESNYDIGDIVGSIDNITGIRVAKPIVRKIIKINKGLTSVSYQVE